MLCYLSSCLELAFVMKWDWRKLYFSVSGMHAAMHTVWPINECIYTDSASCLNFYYIKLLRGAERL